MAMFLGEGMSDTIASVGETLGRAPLDALWLPPWSTLADLEEINAMGLDFTNPAMQRGFSTWLGHFRTACNLRGTVNKYWQGFYGDGLFVHCPAKHFTFGAADEVEMLLGFNGQQLQASLRLRDPSLTPAPHAGWV